VRVEDEFLDVLQNLEFAIVQEFRNDPQTLDVDVRDALVALIRFYEAEEQGRRPPVIELASRPRRIFDSVRAVCEWRLGRPSELSAKTADGAPPSNTPEELVACLKRIRESVRFWTKEGGRRGYLNYVSQFIR